MKEWARVSRLIVAAFALGAHGSHLVSQDKRGSAPRASLETAVEPYDSGGRLGIRIDEASAAFEGTPACIAALSTLRAIATAGKKETADIDLFEWKRRQMDAIRQSLMQCSWRDSTAIVEVALEMIFDPAFHPDVLHQLVTPWVNFVCQRGLVDGVAEESSDVRREHGDIRRSILDGIQRRLLEVDNLELLQEDTPYLFALQLLSQSPHSKDDYRIFFDALRDPALGPRAAKRLGHLARFLVTGRDRGEKPAIPRWARWARSENAALLHPQIMSELVNVVWDPELSYSVATRVEAVQQWLSTQIKMEANLAYRVVVLHLTSKLHRFADGLTETGDPRVREAVQEAFASIQALRATVAPGDGVQDDRKAFKFGASRFPYSISLAVREFGCAVNPEHPLCKDLWFISQQHIWFMDQTARGIKPPVAYRTEVAERAKMVAVRLIQYHDTSAPPLHQDVTARVLLWILHHRGEKLFSKTTRVIRDWLDRSADEPLVRRALEETLLVHSFDSEVADHLVPARRRGVRMDLLREAAHCINAGIRNRAVKALRYLDIAYYQDPTRWSVAPSQRRTLRWAEELVQPAAATAVADAAVAAEDLADLAAVEAATDEAEEKLVTPDDVYRILMDVDKINHGVKRPTDEGVGEEAIADGAKPDDDPLAPRSPPKRVRVE